jgi:hypothetical protein
MLIVRVLVMVFVCGSSLARAAALPDALIESIDRPTSHANLASIMKEVARPGIITVSEIGRSPGGRALFLARVNRGPRPSQARVLIFAQQHGNEPAGKEAALVLLRDLAAHPEKLSREVDLYVIPQINPDGAEKNTRENGGGFDLNRDHESMLQEETRLFYATVRKIMPHVAIDCHEFNRTRESLTRKGLVAWPEIMMDTANHPLFDPYIYKAGLAWVDRLVPVMKNAKINYQRYQVGDFPFGESRPSAFDIDDGRNGVASYGGLGLIIESGVKRAAADPEADLSRRTRAYLTIFETILTDIRRLKENARAVDRIRAGRVGPPPFIPTNYIWGAKPGAIAQLPVIEAATGKTLLIPTPLQMTEPFIKAAVKTPVAYAIEPHSAALFGAMLREHDVRFETLTTPRKEVVQRSRLLRVEEEEDKVHARYGGRQIVETSDSETVELPAGALFVTLDQPAWLRAVSHLEPAALYGVYSKEAYRAMVKDGKIPVLRVMRSEP